MSVMTTSSNSNVSTGGSIKKMIRDTTRLLNRPNLPADLRREQERKLAALQVALTDRVQAETEREMAVKYRMVKFFERKKALRRLASAQAKNDAKAVAEAQLDLAYILHFPKDRKYISLFAANETTDAAVVCERENIRKQIADKLALLGAETLLAKVTKVKTNLKGESEDDESEEDESEDEDESDEDSDDSDNDSDDDDDSDDGLSYDEDDSEDDSDNDDDSDSDDDSDLDADSDDSDDLDDEFDSEDEEDFDSEEEDGSDDDEDDDSDEESDEDSDEEDSEEEEESDSDAEAPKPKKGRH